MTENYLHRALVAERQRDEAMEKLENHTDQVASRLRTKWRREEETWARGEGLPPPEPDASAEWDAIRNGDVFRTAAQERVEQPRSPTMWERWRGYWHRF